MSMRTRVITAIAGLGLALTAASAAAVTTDATTTQQVTAGAPDRPITTGWPGGDREGTSI